MIHYAIPSHARADRIERWALTALAGAGIIPEQVTVFVTPGQEAAYRQAISWGCEVVTGGHGLGAQRRAIDAHYGEGALVVQLDDDIRQVVRRMNEKQLTPVTDLHAEAIDAFALCTQVGARLWGVYPTLNAAWMKARSRVGLSFICGGLFGHVVDPALPVTLDQKEDFERTLLYFEADGAVVRQEWLGMRTSMYNPGGMQAEGHPDRAELNAHAVRALRERWPRHVRVARRTGKAGQELRLV